MQSSSKPDAPWIFRTYAGHSTARDSNALYHRNISKGQTGLSVAFDLPTQTGYDPDDPLALGEVGKVGVPVTHLGDMRALFDGIPLGSTNTSLTINATAPWLLALYLAVAEEQGASRASLQGTTQNDIIKEYLSRGAYVFPPTQSMRLTHDVILFCAQELPKWNPMNVCSYHLQEAGATPVQELAFAMATAIAVLNGVPQSDTIELGEIAGRMSFFCNSGMKLVAEICKMRAFVELWDEILRDRFDVQNEKQRRFRYGVQVNSLGLTEQQPENNVYRILIETLPVVLSKRARARAVQLPAWNEALGLPRPFDQQWSLRIQQILAFETDILEFGDIFDGSQEISDRVEALKAEARKIIDEIDRMGGAIVAVENGFMKSQLVASNAQRVHAIEAGEQIVVGVNRFKESEPSPLLAAGENVLATMADAEEEQIRSLVAWRASRDSGRVAHALSALREAASEGRNIMPPSIEAAKAGVTTGEWGATLRSVLGEYRAPTGVAAAVGNSDQSLEPLRREIDRVSTLLGRRLKFLVGKPGLDGHSNGAEQIALRARNGGMEVVYEGIRLSPEQIVSTALEEGVHCIGLSILSGSHLSLVRETMRLMRAEGLSDIPVFVGGIIPLHDERVLRAEGVASVYTPKDFDITAILFDIVRIVEARHPPV